MTIEEFIEARIAEDERIARAAIDPGRPGSHWCWETTHDGTPVSDGEEARVLEDGHHLSLRTVEEFPLSWDPSNNTLPAFIIGADRGYPGSLPHIARHDPARVLRQCTSLRSILTLAESAMKAHQADYEPSTAGSDEMAAYRTGAAMAYRPALAAIAAIWSVHPDYDPEWVPSEPA